MEIAGRSIDVVRIPPRDAAAPTLVFLHEGLGSIALWRDFPAKLCARTGFGGLLYSRYGNGFSQPLDEPRDARYMHDEALVALPQLLEKTQTSDPVLVGHSDGASIALIYAGAYPKQVRALVVEAPHVVVEDLSVASIAAIGDTYRAGALREKMARHHTDADRTFFGWNDIWLSPQFRSWSILDCLPSIVAPTLAIQGAGDEYGTLDQLSLLAERSGAKTDRVILAGCGHAPHRDRPALVEDAIVTWLAEALPRA